MDLEGYRETARGRKHGRVWEDFVELGRATEEEMIK